jgi:hypothetical protein
MKFFKEPTILNPEIGLRAAISRLGTRRAVK